MSEKRYVIHTHGRGWCLRAYNSMRAWKIFSARNHAVIWAINNLSSASITIHDKNAMPEKTIVIYNFR